MYVNIKINEATGKKKPNFGVQWGHMEKAQANAEAIETGNGLMVVDIDTKDISELDPELVKLLPRVPTVDTARGYHYYFDVEDDSLFKSIDDIFDHVDMKSTGGLVFSDYWGADDRIKYKRMREDNYKLDKQLQDFLLTSHRLKKKELKAPVASSGSTDAGSLSTAEMIECVSFIDPDDSYDTWYKVGMGLKNWDENQGYHVWDEWSQGGAKYNSSEIVYKWESFDGDGVTVGTIIMYARENGYTLPGRESGIPFNEITDDIIPQSSKFYLHNSDYYVHSDRLYSKLTQSAFKAHFRKSGIKLAKGDTVDDYIDIVHGVNHFVDFFEPSSVFLDESVNELTSVVNPTERWGDIGEFDEDIVKEYSEQIMCGVEVDLVNLIVGAMRYNEVKMNKLLLVGESNKGKTELMKLMTFVEMNAGEFKGVLKGIKWSQEQSDQLKQCGLLLADDIFYDIPIALKNISDTATFNIMNRGSVVHPCKFLVMTTTHDSIIGSIGDELKNRIMCMKIEGGITFNDSVLVKKDKRKYERVTKNYIKSLILSALKDPISEDDFYVLQGKYTTQGSNERDEILSTAYDEIVGDLESDLKLEFNSRYEMEESGGEYFVEKKVPIKRSIKEILVQNFDGMEVDLNKELNIMLKRFLSDDRTRIKNVLKYKVLFKSSKKQGKVQKF